MTFYQAKCPKCRKLYEKIAGETSIGKVST